MDIGIEYNRALVSFSELSAEWQEEAISNHGDIETACDQTYIDPLDGNSPLTHSLQDLSDCMRYDGVEYDGIIGISNSCAIGVNISDCGEACRVTYF